MKKTALLSCAFLLSVAAQAAPPDDVAAAALLYKQGQVQQAAQLYERAAIQGDKRAQGTLGLFYEKGLGVPADDSKAVFWLRKAAEQGWPIAEDNLGLLESRGRGGPKDEADAAAWFRKAAEQGLAEAQYHLASAYENGVGVLQDYQSAIQWYTKAAAGIGANENATATVPLSDYSPDQYKHAPEAAAYRIGVFHEYGRGVPVDYKQAMLWYSTASQRNLAVAEFRVGELQERGGAGIAASDHGALYWYQRAADHGLAVGKLKVQALQAGLVSPCTPAETAAGIKEDLPLKPGLWKIEENERGYGGNEHAITHVQCHKETTVCVAAAPAPAEARWNTPALMRGPGLHAVAEVDTAGHNITTLQNGDMYVSEERSKLSDEAYSFKLDVHLDMPWAPQFAEAFAHADIEGKAAFHGACGGKGD